jgi:hypothetical protein
MKSRTFLAGAGLALSASLSQAQFVKGNEAVEPLPGGGHKVQIAPMPTAARTSKPCQANGNCYAGSWRMVETAAGLMECTEPYARPGTCRASSYGITRRSRLWVVKSKGVWLQCQYPELGSKCVPMFARPPANLPYEAVQ